MRLLKLEIYGFKSFARKVELSFEPGITAIIGPNGSGKSNTVDAIRWVLGEQSAKSLRGSKMEDVIFVGSERRKPLGMAEVSLTLDNADGTLALPYREVCIKRRVFRSGEGEYTINGKASRLRDLAELFMNTGLGRDDYSIIDQRKVDAVLGSKPQERRLLLEEAAGIYKYRVKREEALRKLAETEDNSLRLSDLLQELTARLEPLAAEADRAQTAGSLDADISQLSLWLLFQQLSAWRRIKGQTEQDKQKAAAEAGVAHEKTAAGQRQLAELSAQLEAREEEIAALTQRIAEHAAEKERREGDLRVGRERQRALAEQRQRLVAETQELTAQCQELAGRLAKAEEEKVQAERAQNLAQEKLDVVQAQLAQLFSEAETGSQLLETAKGELIDALEELAGYRNRNNSLQEEGERLALRLEKAQSRLSELEEEKAALEQTASQLKTRQDQQSAAKEKLNSQLAANQESCGRASAQQTALQKQLRELREQWAQKTARQKALSEMERHFEGYFRGARNVLERKAQLPGLIGAVADLLSVPSNLEVAVETALGSGLQNIVTQDDKVAQKAIALLRQNNWGRATFLPLNLMRPDKIRQLPAADGVLGLASQLVKYDPQYAPAVEYLLGRTVVTKDLASATRLASLTGSRWRIVTLAGDLISPGGAVSGGSREQHHTGLLARKRQLEELGQLLCRLKTQLEALERQELQCNQQLSSLQADKERLTEEKQQLHLTEVELERDEKEYLEACSRLARQLEAASAEREELTEERAQLEIGKRELGARIQELATREEELRSQLTAQEEEQARWQALRRSSEEELSALRVELGSLGERSAQLASQKDELAERCQSAQDRREKTLARDAQLALEAEKLQANLAQLEQELQSQGQARLELEQELSRLRASRGLMREQVRTVSQQAQEEKLALEQAQGRLHEYEIQLARLDAEGEKLAEELWEKHQLKVEQLSEAAVPQLAISRQEAQRNIKQLMGKRQELGNVNFGAIEELKQLQGRVRFLESQLQDLKQARAALLDLIEEIDHTSRRKLAATFSEVNAAFGMVFGKLFRGGAGHLELSAPEGERVDPLTAGVEVMVQLPGKKQQHIQLLSGGERAFVAIAFLFSILKVHPAPFCVLDEIDAPLDEANLQRFSALLREFVAQTQFIVVTHRRRTMEEADALYGVTMQEAGISQLVSVRLQDAI